MAGWVSLVYLLDHFTRDLNEDIDLNEDSDLNGQMKGLKGLKDLKHQKKCLNDRKCIQLSIISDLQHLINLNRYLHDLTELQNVLMINEISIQTVYVQMQDLNQTVHLQ